MRRERSWFGEQPDWRVPCHIQLSKCACQQSLLVTRARGRDWFLTSSPEIFPASHEAEMCGDAFCSGNSPRFCQRPFPLSRSGLMGRSCSGYHQLGWHRHSLESLGPLLFHLGCTFFGGGIEEVQHHFSLRDSSFHWEKVKRSMCSKCWHWLTCYCEALLCGGQNFVGLWKELLWSNSSSVNRWIRTCPVKYCRSLSFLVLTSGCDAVFILTVLVCC